MSPDERKADDGFISSLVGGHRLVRVDEPKDATVWGTYRASYDDTYTRFDRMDDASQFRWRARTSDGMTYEFGGATAVCPNIISDGYAPLTRSFDAFGNSVTYSYVMANGECRLQTVTYGANTNAGLSDFAEISLQYAAPNGCGGVWIGSQTEYRSGTKLVSGTAQLTSITAKAIDPSSAQVVHTRVITLGYDADSEACDASNLTHSPVRLLTSIQESAWQTGEPVVSLPAVTFDYGSPTVGFDQQLMTSSWLGGGLNYGTRYEPITNKWPTLEATLIDMDGDARPDRVFAGIGDDGTGTQTCRAIWHRNLGVQPDGSIAFGSGNVINLPRLKWRANATAPDPFLEGCSLNAQHTNFQNMPADGPDTYLAYRWLDADGDGLVDLAAAIYHNANYYDVDAAGEPPPLGPWPSCSDPQPDTCSNLSSGCMSGCNNEATGFDWNCAVTCMADAEKLPCAQHMAKAASGGPDWGLDTPPYPYPAGERKAYFRCGGLYPWFIYPNRGNGVFSNTPIIKYYPKPLDPETANAAISSPLNINSDDMFTDIEGDGVRDIVVRYKTTEIADPPFYWQVWLGDGKYGVERAAYPMLTREWASMNSSFLSGNDVVTTGGVLDLNHDGLLDQWEKVGPLINVAMNDGTGFRITPSGLGEVWLTPDPQLGTSPRLGTSTWHDATTSLGNWVSEGTQWTRDRMIDVDADGRLDVFNIDGEDPTQPGDHRIYLNTGGNFSAVPISYPTDYPSQDLRGQVNAWHDGAAMEYRWEQRSDFVDLDADGLAEFVTAFYVGGIQRTLHRVDGKPPRLMTSISNGRGATTTITYDSMHSATVTEDPASCGNGCTCSSTCLSNHRANPRTGWVVKSVTTADAVSSTTAVTSYHYTNPRYIADSLNQFSFRGFDEVTTTLPTGAQTVHRYSFTPDWSGRLVATLTIPAEAPNEVRSIETTSWGAFPLWFGTTLTTGFHPIRTEHFTCSNGQPEAACLSAPAGYTRTTNTWTPIDGAGIPRLYAPTETLLQAGSSDAPGDRKTENDYALAFSDASYRLAQTSKTMLERDISASWNMYAKTRQLWDSELLVSQGDETWVDSDDNNTVISHREYDMTTGNLLRSWKPKQWADNPYINLNYTEFTYDSRKLFVATEKSPAPTMGAARAVRDYVYEYGTGTKLETLGPNIPPCAVPTPHTCPTGQPEREDHRIRVDGVGRMIERYETDASPGSNYLLYNVEINTYVDAYSGGVPPSVTHQTAIDGPNVHYRQETTELDGMGRPFRKTVEAGTIDEITTFVYRNDGTLQYVRVPDPSANNANLVTYNYYFDSLGRPTYIGRPDGNAVSILYDGLTQRTVELVPPPALAAQTLIQMDSFGRTTMISEYLGGGWPTTHYAYGPDDSVRRVTNPDGLTTCLYHDFAGRRTAIARPTTLYQECPSSPAGLRAWNYGYDQNGNIESEMTPCEGTACAQFTTTTSYDALDRPTKRYLAPRDLSPDDVELFGADHENFYYDAGNNAVGRLFKWWSFGTASGGTPTLESVHMYTAAGQDAWEKQTSNVAGYSNLQRLVYSRYYVSGLLYDTFFYDIVGTQNCQNGSYANYAYDVRGLPFQVQVQNCVYGPTAYSYVRNIRNVAGLVTKRYSIPGSGAITYAESNWTYDQLGRVTSQIVNKGNPLQQVVRQDLSYLGNDDPATLDHYLGTNQKHFTFSYDERHQLTSANETTTPNYFSATYEFNVDGRFKHATESGAPQPGGNVVPRDVEYQYQGADPEQLTALIPTGSTDPYASYSYDDAGNQTMRCMGTITGTQCSGESLSYQYDGKNQLRRATKRDTTGAIVGSEEYWYDNAGSRNQVVKRDAAGNKTEMVWFMRGNVEAHYDAAGTVTKAYGYVSMGTPAFRFERNSDAGSTVEYLFQGFADNTIAAVDQISGTINASFSYAPFGEIIEATDGGGTAAGIGKHRRRMNDKFVDELSDLAYYGFRYYDKTSMTWTQDDPLFRFLPDLAQASSPRSANLYSFSRNNPLRYIDPDGRVEFGMSGNEPNYVFNQLAENQASEGWRGHETPATYGRKRAKADINSGADVAAWLFYAAVKAEANGYADAVGSPAKGYGDTVAQIDGINHEDEYGRPIVPFSNLAANDPGIRIVGGVYGGVIAGGILGRLGWAIASWATADSIAASPPAAATFDFIAKNGEKINRQISRWADAFNIALKGTTFLQRQAMFLSYASNLARNATAAGTYVTGRVGNMDAATIYRYGSEFLVIHGNAIMSYVANARAGEGIAATYQALGGM